VCRCVAYQNVYRSGYYHRAGKPGQFDRHPGDLYPTRDAAEADVDPPWMYVDTVKVVWYEDAQPHVNCATSKPVPISESRRQIRDNPQGEYQDGVWQPLAREGDEWWRYVQARY
jgi:hypothetical protein